MKDNETSPFNKEGSTQCTRVAKTGFLDYDKGFEFDSSCSPMIYNRVAVNAFVSFYDDHHLGILCIVWSFVVHLLVA